MVERDKTRSEVLFSDVPGDAAKVHDILAEWGVEETAIRRLLSEHRPDLLLRPAPDASAGHTTSTPTGRHTHAGQY